MQTCDGLAELSLRYPAPNHRLGEDQYPGRMAIHEALWQAACFPGVCSPAVSRSPRTLQGPEGRRVALPLFAGPGSREQQLGGYQTRRCAHVASRPFSALSRYKETAEIGARDLRGLGCFYTS